MAEVKGIYLHRLLTLVIIIVTPIYFFLLMNFLWLRSPFIIPFFEYYIPGSSEFIIKWVMPITFTAPWWIFLILYRNKYANSFVEMKERFIAIPKRWIVFYGINGLLVIAVLFIPFITPTFLIITVGLLAHDIYLLTASEREGRGKYFIFVIILILMEIFPVTFQLAFVQSYLTFWNDVFSVWMLFVPYLFKITIIMADALEFGGIIWLIYAGAIEFEQGSGLAVTTEVPETRIKIFQIILFSLFSTLWIISLLWPVYTIYGEILFFIDVTALVVGVVILIISVKKNISKEASTEPFIGYVFMLSFLFLEVFQTIPYLFGLEPERNVWLMSIIILIAGILYLIMWFLSFIVAEKDDY